LVFWGIFYFKNIQQEILSYISLNLPGLSDVLTSNIQNVIDARGALSIIGVIGFVWSGAGLFGALDNAVNRASGITRLRPFFIRKPRDIGFIIGWGYCSCYPWEQAISYDCAVDQPAAGRRFRSRAGGRLYPSC
jgi:uncharacterized BrkB/YihY/UPF0761 family membrane protein